MRQIILIAITIIFLSSSNSISHDHLSNLDDISICLGKDGDGITSHQYDMVNEYRYKIKTKAVELAAKRRGYDYALEAYGRNLDWGKCKELISNYVPILESNQVDEITTIDSSTVKSKLKELKSMLAEGLISQEQYDIKSTKILEGF